MAKPISPTTEMVEEFFADIKAEFEKAFETQKAEAISKKLADGTFTFHPPKTTYSWEDDNSRARLIITPEAFSKTMVAILKTDKEIGWHGVIHRDEQDGNTFVLEDIVIFPQTVAAATVDADPVEYPQWMMSLPNEVFEKMRFHGHSHVNMPVSPSGRDMKYREELIAQFNDGFYVFLIINKKLEITCQIYDFDNNALYDTEEIDISIGEDGLESDVEKAVEVMVKNTVYKYNSPIYPHNAPTTTPAIPQSSSVRATKNDEEDGTFYDRNLMSMFGENWRDYFD